MAANAHIADPRSSSSWQITDQPQAPCMSKRGLKSRPEGGQLSLKVRCSPGTGGAAATGLAAERPQVTSHPY